MLFILARFHCVVCDRTCRNPHLKSSRLCGVYGCDDSFQMLPEDRELNCGNSYNANPPVDEVLLQVQCGIACEQNLDEGSAVWLGWKGQ
jgi:hypothetical protein